LNEADRDMIRHHLALQATVLKHQSSPIN